MLVHEFLFVPSAELSHDISYSLAERKPCIIISDDTILKNRDVFFKGFTTHWDSIFEENVGLNYYGITIIMFEELPLFIERIKTIKNNFEIEILVTECNIALQKKFNLVHFGI